LELRELESTIEGILFAAGDPVSIERICMTLEVDKVTAERVLSKLMDYYAYERRGIRIVRLENNYQMCSAPEFGDLIRKAFERRKPARLSQPAMEVLAIIAYYQPATRAYVEQIRGVDSSYTVNLLLERGLIEECGRLNVPGRPMQFRTTDTFLRSFSLSGLDDLPELPSTSPEDGQISMEMQEKLRHLQEETQREEEGKLAAAEEHRLAVEEALQNLAEQRAQLFGEEEEQKSQDFDGEGEV